MLNQLRKTIAAVALFAIIASASAETSFVPTIHDPNVASVTLFAENPDIVTPIGVAVAPDGRVFVQENHTHKRTSDYDGPETDRILIFEDTNNDGVADKRTVFYEGHTFSTDLLFGPDGHLYVSTRWFVGRFLNAATATNADGEPEKIIECVTDGDYPHNGVGGLAIDPANPDWLAFGFGENLGAPYKFVGTDGTTISGGNEGGSTYLCRTDGSQLRRQSTGHWNAFGMAYDTAGNLFSTDNDPNATPPNRLLHVIPGADFGYEYRYGRSGQHPLVSWFGEIPGTLGMIGPLGEAACGVIPFGTGRLLTASWTDNRVDVHDLKPSGASFIATREPLLSGPDEFRPVHFSYSHDGRFLYISDWVKLDYPVHGHGRIWRVEFKQPIDNRPAERSPVPTMTAADALTQLGSADPYVRTAAIDTLVKSPSALSSFDIKAEGNPIARAHFAVARKRVDPAAHAALIPQLLNDSDEQVRFVAIKWIGDKRLSQYRDALQALLANDDISGNALKAVFAAIARLNNDDNKEFSPGRQMLALALDATRPASLRAVALRNVSLKDAENNVAKLAPLADGTSSDLQRETVQTLVMLSSPEAAAALAKVATNPNVDSTIRADAIAGLASSSSQYLSELQTLQTESDSQIAEEARRTMASAGIVDRPLDAKPAATDLDAWEQLLEETPGNPNLDVGRRLFFHSKLATCYKCHAIRGRGHNIGPDLTTIHRQSNIDRRWLLRHIINPSAEVAPYYRPQLIITVDGEAKTGFIVGREGKRQGYLAADGELFYVNKSDVEDRREMKTSIMPTGLLDKLTPTEIRDLIAFVLNGDSDRQAQKPAPVGPARKLADGFRFTEGPAYAGNGVWYFSDLPNKTLHRWTETNGVERVRTGVDGFSNGIVVDEQGRLIFCEVATRSVIRRSSDGTEDTLADRCDGLPIGMPNDLWLAPERAVYFTIPKTNKKRARVVPTNAVNGTVCMISPDRSSVRDVGLELTSPNGIVGSSDGRFLYVADPGAQSCWRYTIEPDGTLSNQQLAADRGSDGLAVDEYGNLYVTARDDGIAVFDSNANQIATIPVPERPANMKFGGPENRTLFITARTSIYAVQMNVRGG